MFESFSGLKINHWYHVLIVMGAVGIAGSVMFELKGIRNSHALLLSSGVFCIGMGEWINHPLQTKIHPPNAYLGGGFTTTGYPRHNSFIGCLFDLLGASFIAVAAYKIIHAA